MYKIFLGEGLDKIKFGMSRDDVKKILGEPDEIDEFDYEDSDDKSVAWHYDELELSVGFDQEAEWQLVSIAVSNPETELAGKKLIGLVFDEAVKEIEKLNLGDLEVEDVENDEDENSTEGEKNNYKELYSDDSNISFWFDENILTEIQWGPMWEE
jgi:hypothetical protein